MSRLGLRALVTGGAHGIGLACSQRLAAVGYDVSIADADIGVLKRVTLDLRRQYRVDVTSHACDLRRIDHQEALVGVIGSVDVVVHAAGHFDGGTLEETAADSWSEGWSSRVFATINLSRLLLPMLEERTGGVVVTILGNPLAERAPGADGPNSDASPASSRVIGAVGNAALAEFTRVVGSRSLRTGVRVVAVDPGPTVTPELAEALADEAERRLGDRRRWWELVAADPVPNRPEDVADVVSFLVSTEASSLSGTVVELGPSRR